MSSTTGTHDPERSEKQAPPLSMRVRAVQLIFLVAAVAATFALAYWQFSRWETTSSFQNLGYALQWPAFGVFFIWAYRKYMQYEKERAAGNPEAAVRDDGELTEIPEGFLPERAQAPAGADAPSTARPAGRAPDHQDPMEDK